MLSGCANNGDGGPRERGTLASRQVISFAESATRFLVDGIDDLAKYRIVGLLYECPTIVGDAACYAAHLGFHSVEVTRTLLDELADAGILLKEQMSGGLVHYRLLDDPGLRRRLMPLYGSPGATNRAGMLRLLASRSLLRAERRAKTARRRGPLAQPVSMERAGTAEG